MTARSIKKKIKKKFGSYSEFARLANIDRYELQKNLLTAKNPKEIYMVTISSLCDSVEVTPSYPYIGKKELKELKELIVSKGGVIKFCKEMKYSQSSVFPILSGKYKPMLFKDKMTKTPYFESLVNSVSRWTGV